MSTSSYGAHTGLRCLHMPLILSLLTISPCYMDLPTESQLAILLGGLPDGVDNAIVNERQLMVLTSAYVYHLICDRQKHLKDYL